MYNSFQEKEIKILRNAIDKATEKAGKKVIQSPDIQKIIKIVENFLNKENCICYGGTAINNILPKKDRFYNKNIELPDYDFFSPKPLEHAKKLANIYYNAGYQEVEAKSGVHYGTFKVFVNYIPVADITYIDKDIFKAIKKEAIRVNNIYYCPPNYLRMAMYLELSRPDGDVSRWEKILKRLILLNKNFPLKGKNCNVEQFTRKFEGNNQEKDIIYNIVKNSCIDQELVFFGGYATTLYSRHMPLSERNKLKSIPDFDLLSEDPYISCIIIKKKLEDENIKNVNIVQHNSIGEIIPEHYEIKINKDTVAFIYKPNACHSYNVININSKKVRIATIDTMLSFYLSFVYSNKPYYDKNRLLCMSEYLFKVQARNRLEQKGLLKRFSINCYGNQQTLEEIRAEKNNMYKQLHKNKNSQEYQYYFLRYIPADKKNNKSRTAKKSKSRIAKKSKSRTAKKSKSRTAKKSKSRIAKKSKSRTI